MLGRTLRGGALALGLALMAGPLAGCTAAGPPPPAMNAAQVRSTPPQIGEPFAATLAAVPADNRQSPEKVALGRALFFEARLSVDGKVSCASCHAPARAFTDGRPTSVGVRGQLGQRNAPTILNALYAKTLFWDGRTTTLEDQAGLPIVNPSEMGQPDVNAAVAAIARDGAYQRAFRQVFGRPPNAPDLVRAIASYERSERAFGAPFDAFAAGDAGAISAPARRGWALFNGKGRCSLCHAPPAEPGPDRALFMDQGFHNIGVGVARHDLAALACRAQARPNPESLTAADRTAISSELSALGSYIVTRQPADIAAFKTPSLRNVMVTAPYFHDGSARTLWDVVDHYNKGGGSNAWLDGDIRPLRLSEPEIDDLVAFLAALTSAPFRDQGAAELARQRQIARMARPERDTAAAFGPKRPLPDPGPPCAPAAPLRVVAAGAR